MARLTAGRRITIEDFDADNHDIVRKLAFILNPFMSEVSAAFNGQITIDNLNMGFQTLAVEVDANGDITNTAQFQNNLKTFGIITIAASPDDGVSNITGAPFVTSRTANGVTEIQNVTGLQANKTYNLNLLIIGS